MKESLGSYRTLMRVKLEQFRLDQELDRIRRPAAYNKEIARYHIEAEKLKPKDV